MAWMTRVSTLAVLVGLVGPVTVAAQGRPDPSGHWEGSVRVQDNEIPFVVDVVSSPQGIEGTMGMPSENIVGVPLQEVSVDGRTLTFRARRDQRFSGMFSDDGTWVVGEFLFEGYRPPFTMKRMGAARVDPPLTSASITPALSGHWVAALQAGGRTFDVILDLTNRGDGSAVGALTNETEGGLRVPLTIEQNGNQVTLKARAITAGFAGSLDPASGTLAGTWTEGPVTVPATFRRTPGGQ